MTATFLVKIEVGSVDEIDMAADDIMDSLAGDGFEMISVEPWARPTQDIGGEEGGAYGGTTLPLF
jgi:hypothetical protein